MDVVYGRFNVAKGAVLELLHRWPNPEFEFANTCVIDGTIKGDEGGSVKFTSDSKLNGTIEISVR